VGGEVCVSNDSQRLLAAAETKNNGRGAQQQLRRGTCFVFMFYILYLCLEFVSQQIVDALHDDLLR
jgi:hypothetical protein